MHGIPVSNVSYVLVPGENDGYQQQDKIFVGKVEGAVVPAPVIEISTPIEIENIASTIHSCLKSVNEGKAVKLLMVSSVELGRDS